MKSVQKFILVPISLFGLWVSLPATALMVDDLYVAQVLTSAQNREALIKGAEQGLLQVLIKASGDPDVARNTLVIQSLPRASTLYYQYSFSTSEETFELDGKTVPAWLLTLHFDARAVTSLLQEAGLPIWGKNRPAVMVWMAVNEGRDRYLLNSEEASPIAIRLRQHAARRGLPLVFPLMDLEDTSVISSKQVWNASLTDIDTASARYRPDATLTARLSRNASGMWSAKWYYKPSNRWLGLSRNSESLENLLAEMMDRMANELASLYAHGSEAHNVWVRVQALGSATDYAGLSQYLGSLSLVNKAAVDLVQGDSAWYRLTISGDKNQLVEIIDLDRKMRLLGPGDGMSRDTALQYQWIN
ncbi:MAG: DUF2066 domain-containing protein [Gammaproteobacteria bacterium]|nr:DUF2066 domain-containing protein [Gammaproteobacteria bacterium]